MVDSWVNEQMINDLQTAVYLILRHLTTEEQLTTKEIIEIKKLIRVA